MAERIQKILAQWGIASRRHAEQFIAAGRVRVNGQVATLGQQADPRGDRLELDGKILTPNQTADLVYILLNKPRGVVSTCADPQGRRTVLDCLEPQWCRDYRLYPVGRLDTDSTGAILLTNDGVLTLKLTHPRYHLAKTYHVWVQGHPPPAVLQQWRQGIPLDHHRTQPAQVTILKTQPERTHLRIVLKEGRNRQIRRMATELGYPVLQLHRVAIGTLSLDVSRAKPLASGQYRILTPAELARHFTNHHSLNPHLPNPIAEKPLCKPQTSP
ncbi:MAG: rRNA pseudouridine synthase [Spirulina sp. DLM2.Bin59]|nr:MAG: rRNA pseudouridine synthase [Spirulina sp. DLM2.Bin59]